VADFQFPVGHPFPRPGFALAECPAWAVFGPRAQASSAAGLSTGARRLCLPPDSRWSFFVILFPRQGALFLPLGVFLRTVRARPQIFEYRAEPSAQFVFSSCLRPRAVFLPDFSLLPFVDFDFLTAFGLLQVELCLFLNYRIKKFEFFLIVIMW
jgi:hypothetical protein